MSDKEPTHGLTCPNCGGIVPIPEGQAIVRCPYCDLRTLVRGERGLRRYQVPVKVRREDAQAILQKFLGSSMAIGMDAKKQAQLKEAFLVYLPFWTVWGRVAGWAFGEEKQGSGDQEHYVPREVRIVQEMTWTGASCDVGEFGVGHILLAGQQLAPFDSQALHMSGMVFEPVNSFSDAQAAADAQFQEQVRRKASLDRQSQLFTRTVKRSSGLVYYPLLVIRYLYRGRVFPVIADGYSGKVLYGKAPGNTLYRAGMLVGGMALGAFLGIDLSFFVVSQSSNNSGSGTFWFALFLLVAGLGMMLSAYRAFRYGEQYEYRSAEIKEYKDAGPLPGSTGPMEILSQVKEVEQWINRLS